MKTILKSTSLFAAGAAATIAFSTLGPTSWKPSGPWFSRSTSNAAVPGKSERQPGSPATAATALGSIQPDGGVREVALPPGAIPRRLEEGVAVGRQVDEGKPLAYLDGYKERQSEIKVIEAEITAAEQSLRVEDEHEKAALEEIDHERERVRQLGALQHDSLTLKLGALVEKANLARHQFEAVHGLQVDHTVSGQDYENLQSLWRVSEEELKSARSELRRIEAELELNTSSATIGRRKRQVQMAAKRARAQISLETLLRKKALAEAALSRFVVIAPIKGTVLEICTQPGEAPTGNPLLKLGDTSRLYVLAEIYEDDRKNVDIGQAAEIRGRGLPPIAQGEHLNGKVERIAPAIGHRRQYPLNPTSRDNARVYPAWIRLDFDETKEDERKLERTLKNYILQPVEVTIRGEEAGVRPDPRPTR